MRVPGFGARSDDVDLDVDAVGPDGTPSPAAADTLGETVVGGPAPGQEPDLARSTRSGLVWSAGSRTFGQVLQFGSSIVLARLLTPRDFGLIATVYIFAGLASLLKEMGIASSIVRKREVSDADLATAFWVNTLVGFGFTLLVGASGPLLARLYDAPELVALMWLVALNFTLGLHGVPLALLERSMRFSVIAKVDVTAAVLGTAAALTAAFNGLGYYSLIVSPLVQSVVMTVVFVSVTRFRPKGFIDRKAAAELWAYTSGYTGANLLTYLRGNMDGLIVGKALGQAPLGFYGRAMVLVTMPLSQITSVLHRVMLPTLSRLRDEPHRLRWAYLSTMSVVCVAAASGMAVLAAVAHVLVPFIWGERWAPVVPIIHYLAVAGAMEALNVPTGWICEVEGRTRLLMRLTLVTTTITLVGIVIGISFGVVGVATSLAVTATINLVPSLLVVTRLLGLQVPTVLRHLLPGVLVAGLAGAAALGAVTVLTDVHAALRLLAAGAAALATVVVSVPVADRVVRTGIMQAVRRLLGKPSLPLPDR